MTKKFKWLSTAVNLIGLILPFIDSYIDAKQQEELIEEKLKKAFQERGL